MDITIVLATYNRDVLLQATLNSFRQLALPDISWQCIVVDNACRTETKLIAESYSSDIPITYLRQGKPGKNNALLSAMPYATGELIVFTDDDIIAEKFWLLNLWEASKRLKDYDLFGGRILPYFPNGKYPDPVININHSFTRSAYVISDWELPEGKIAPGNIWGPNMAVRRRVFDAGLTFNPNIGPTQSSNYTMGSETEFLLRASKAGYRSAYIPSALVRHQIREEQLSINWIKKRAIRFGKGKAALRKEFDAFPKIFGIPRFLFKKIILLHTLSLFYRATGIRKKYYNIVIELGINKGVLLYYKNKD